VAAQGKGTEAGRLPHKTFGGQGMKIGQQALIPPAGGAEPRTQYGALCWRDHGKGLEVLLVTSRETGRWVIPKGWPIRNLTPEESAAREAWEEAGVKGSATPECLGIYSYEKGVGRPAGPRVYHPCVVAVYPLAVRQLAKTWPEAKQRKRKWFTPKKAARKVDEPELQALLAALPGLLAPDAAESPAPAPGA